MSFAGAALCRFCGAGGSWGSSRSIPALGRGVPELLLVIVPVPGGQPGSALWEHRDVLLPPQMLVTPFLKELGVFREVITQLRKCKLSAFTMGRDEINGDCSLDPACLQTLILPCHLLQEQQILISVLPISSP